MKIIYPPPFRKEKGNPNVYGGFPYGESVYKQRTANRILQASPAFVSGYREAIYQIKKLNR